MWKAILLFSLVVFAFGSDLKERFSLKVKVVGRIVEEKPRLLPPERIQVEEELAYLDLSSRLIEPPKDIEEATLRVPEGERGCGEPKDRAYYRAAVRYYLKGKFKKAETRALDVMTLQRSAFLPQARYILGLVYYRTDRWKEALGMFERSCGAVHPYRDAACESLYALKLMMGESIEERTGYDLWDKVIAIRSGEEVAPPDCSTTAFLSYCSYVEDFVKGMVNENYRASTEIRRAIVLIGRGETQEAARILKRYTEPGSRYRLVALYYMGVIYLEEGEKRRAYRMASILETLDPDLAKDLYRILGGKGVVLSRVAYQVTGLKDVLRKAGVLSYNSGNYTLAYREFLDSGDLLFAVWSAVRAGDYRGAYRVVKGMKPKTKEDYLWMLEVLYWAGNEEEMSRVLEEVREKHPDIYREYMGWLLFRKERWREAANFFRDPYHRALAFYNAGEYGKVFEILKGGRTYKERILKAKAAVSMGRGDLARKFLKGQTPEEIYLLGMSYFIEEAYDKAIEQFQRIRGSDSIGRRALLRIGDSLYNLGKYDQAKEVYKNILRSFPDSKEATEATLALAQIELQVPSADLKDLVKEFERKFPDSPLIPDLRYQLANLYMREGQTVKAREIFESLLDHEALRPKVLIRIAEIETDPAKKEEMLKEVIRTGDPEQREEATKLLTDLYYERKEFEKLADLLAEGGYQERKRALVLYMEHNMEKAVSLFEDLLKENPDDEEIRILALKMYDKTKGKRYLEVARESGNPEVRAQALYRLGKLERRKDRRKALEYFVEVVLMPEKVQPYYNLSILEAVDILVKMKARKDASCLLARIDPDHLSKDQAKKVKILKKRLPKCEVKK